LITAKAAGHVAVKRAVADRHFRLVAGGQHQRASLVGQRHQDIAADARLDVFFGGIGGKAGEQRVEHRRVGLHGRRDGKLVIAHAELAIIARESSRLICAV
jgi:hypothetical protein